MHRLAGRHVCAPTGALFFRFGIFKGKGGSASDNTFTGPGTFRSQILTEESAGMGLQGQGRPLAQAPTDSQGRSQVAGSFKPGDPIPTEDIDNILIARSGDDDPQNRLPISYEIEALKVAKLREMQAGDQQQKHDVNFDEFNMPREPENETRVRASWEYQPTEEHKSLVLILYRHILKGLIDFKSVRKRSLFAFARFAFRRRAHATEKLLIDECIEEARRAIYVLGKHHAFTESKNYEYDSMSLPKDTGQDVKKYMEEVYDPEISRQQFKNFSDVQPGKEHLHNQSLSPTSGAHHWREKRSAGVKVNVSEDDMVRRPPPPPDMGGGPATQPG